MTATQLQFRRGSAAQMATFTGAQGEVVVDTSNNRVVVHDGATAGGWPAARIAEVSPQCGRLSYVSATQIKFAPFNGGSIKIAGLLYPIPSAGITAANTSVYVNGVAGQNLAAATLYYVYLFNNAGTLTIDFSTTAYATDTTTGNVGVVIKSGDNTRSLVGWLYTNGSGGFGTGPLLNVNSWFNTGVSTPVNFGPFTNNSITGTTSYKMFGYGSSFSYVPIRSGTIIVSGSFRSLGTTASGSSGDDYALYYGIGSAPANGAAATGTLAVQMQCSTPNGATNMYAIAGTITGLTLGTPYWLDLAGLLGAGSATMQLFGPGFFALEL
jgi:hypothetical protein